MARHCGMKGNAGSHGEHLWSPTTRYNTSKLGTIYAHKFVLTSLLPDFSVASFTALFIDCSVTAATVSIYPLSSYTVTYDNTCTYFQVTCCYLIFTFTNVPLANSSKSSKGTDVVAFRHKWKHGLAYVAVPCRKRPLFRYVIIEKNAFKLCQLFLMLKRLLTCMKQRILK